MLLRLALLLCRHGVADHAAAGGSEHAMVRHMTGNAANDGALDAPLRHDRARRRQSEDDRGR